VSVPKHGDWNWNCILRDGAQCSDTKKYIVNIEKISGWFGSDASGQFQISYQPRF